MLSRLPLPEIPTDVPLPGETIVLLDMLNCLPEQIRQWIDNDPVLSRVQIMLQKGWQDTSYKDLKVFQTQRDELSALSFGALM